jgi:hypothetical protein
METGAADPLLSWENLIYIIDFLQSSGQRHVSLLGGEPTTHPDYVDFVVYLLERGFDVTTFTNGIISAGQLKQFEEHLTRVDPQRLQFVCNLNDPVQTPAPQHETEKISAFLSLMGPWTGPGFNIYRLDFNLDFLFDVINRYGLKRHLRLGLTHPIPGAKNAHIRPSEIRQVIQRLYWHRMLFDRFRVRPGLDCGFPICQFSDEELGWLHRFGSFQFSCGPAFDIAPDMSLYYCFPLSNYRRKSLFAFDSLAQIEDYFAQLRDELKNELAGIYPECDGCTYQQEGICTGGGLCQVVGRFVHEEPVRISEIEDGMAKIRMSQ